MAKTVFIIFKTHLDIGFTDYAEKVIKNYLTEFIPNAIRVGYELKETQTPFVWTVGSWIVDKALREDKTGNVERAIKDGIINWHGLPFTTHTELMNETLFEYGVGIAQQLDKKFGKKTIAAKMTDVPGHTIGMIPIMSRAGLKFLHLGVNPATPLPPVPSLFRWKCGNDSIVVMYQGDYGMAAEFGDFILYFAHTHDNCGPQSKEEIIEIYEIVKKKYPDFDVKAATLNDVAEKICRIRDLPVIEKEIGDTWIHGAGTDPQKLSRYRNILRNINDEKLKATDISDTLLLVPEHTWGMDVKTYFHDTDHFAHDEIVKTKSDREAIEFSWHEQRDYVIKAERQLQIVSEYPIFEPKLSEYSRCKTTENMVFEISWQLFDRSDYERYKKRYMRLTKENESWALWDFTKVGLPDYKGKILSANLTATYEKNGIRFYKLEFDKKFSAQYGLPYFWAEISGESIKLKWFNKRPSRLPQAFWFKIKGTEENWELNKMGQWIKASNIIGSPLIAAVDIGVRNNDVIIETLDSALVAPFGRKLLQYGLKNPKQNLYFNLYNNIWNTNFPMWYSDDALFRFTIKQRINA